MHANKKLNLCFVSVFICIFILISSVEAYTNEVDSFSEARQIEISDIYNGHGKQVKKTATNDIETFYFGEHYEISTQTETKYIFAGNQRIAQVISTGTQFFHKDHLGSTTAMTDETGSQIETSEYLPYGLQRESTGENETAYKFTDQVLDASTYLNNYDARLYDPAIGKFISPEFVFLSR